MPKGKKAKGKKVTPAPAVVKKQEAKKVVNPLFEKRPKNFGIGQDIQPKQDLTRFVNLEDKGALAKLVEGIRNNYNDRYDEIRLHWGGNVLAPKSVARIAKLEKAKAKELATKLG
ncbi:60S ribosomal protein L7a [Cricetulus griseus]|uniref:60S ribosomal protein L7a n=1 Tax=Cricetulus griseus TaxID=10029 RepID=G3HTI6_CRIGR|nr:60S ribosomal protein L7a [Cricetulus griseus]